MALAPYIYSIHLFLLSLCEELDLGLSPALKLHTSFIWALANASRLIQQVLPSLCISSIMTINFAIPRKTESLIDVQQPELFPINIPVQHHQLKNHISTRDGDCLYYASQFEIFALHLPTNQRRLVQLLRFRPCCLDAAHNWICVGGQHKGQCAFIEIQRPTDHSSSRSSYAHPAEVDDLLPLDLDPDSRALIHHGSSTPPSSPWRHSRYILHEFNLGGNIMNSVAVRLLPGGRKGLEDETVAVLTWVLASDACSSLSLANFQ